MAFYKSSDFGRSWIPLQYFSNNCQKDYGLPANGVITKANEQAAICDDRFQSSDQEYRDSKPRIVFSFTKGRPSAHNLDNSPVLQDWLTVTDFKVIFKSMAPHALTVGGNYLSLSDVVLAGRCKCNGHASKCVKDENDNTVCACEHNTAGPDCDKCKPFYMDRPWYAATKENANECVVCQCNNHSKKCAFSQEMYESSGRKSGGVCLKCRHNTAGVHCESCKDGYYPNPSKRFKTRKACKECGCHPYGSVSKYCDPQGNCFCKEGVTGKDCNACKPGYIQSKNPLMPCKKIEGNNVTPRPRNTFNFREKVKKSNGKNKKKKSNGDDSTPVDESCGNCRAESVRMDHAKFCQSNFVMKARVIKKEKSSPGWFRFNIDIQKIYKSKEDASQGGRVKRGEQYIYVRRDHLHCKCPKLRIGKTYLMSGINKGDHDGLLLDKESIVVRYRKEFGKRFKYMEELANQGGCYRYLV